MCIFCMIANHEINSSIIYEDEKVVAFLDLSQVTKGHTLVVPKKHYANLIECDSEDLAHVIKVTQMLGEIKSIDFTNENDAIEIKFNESEKQNLEEICNLLK